MKTGVKLPRQPRAQACEGEGEGKFGAVAYLAFDPESAAVGFDDVLGDGEAEAGAAGFAGAGGVHAIEAFEDAFLIRQRNADAGVGDGDDGFARAGGGADVDVPAWRRVLDGVVEEILENVAEQSGIAADGGKLRRDV